jgi:hypothetical protein
MQPVAPTETQRRCITGSLELAGQKLALGDRKCEHGVILKIVSTNICDGDQHMVGGRH